LNTITHFEHSPAEHSPAENSPLEHCPCGSEKTYLDCCGPVIAGQPALSAEALMRSRYTAYATRQIDHLIASTYPKLRARCDRQETTEWANRTTWNKLTILEHKINSPHEAHVEFIAHYFENKRFEDKKSDGENVEKTLHENSLFKKVEGRWYYHSGVTPSNPAIKNTTPKLGRNDPCLCGSGKKFKKCCGS